MGKINDNRLNNELPKYIICCVCIHHVNTKYKVIIYFAKTLHKIYHSPTPKTK